MGKRLRGQKETFRNILTQDIRDWWELGKSPESTGLLGPTAIA